MKKHIWISMICVASLAVGGVALWYWEKTPPSPEAGVPEAVGLRGQSKVTRSLSSTQEKKMNDYLINPPPPGHPRSHSSESGMDRIKHVQTINRFNGMQTR